MEILARILEKTHGDVDLRSMKFDRLTESYSVTDRILTRDLQKIENFVESASDDVFHGVATRTPGASSDTKDDIYEVVAIGLDIDFKTIPIEQFEIILAEFPLKPTVIVDSGQGRHPYWFLAKPFRINGEHADEKIAFIEDITKGMAKIFHGDSTHNINRILRTPGSSNSKYAHRPKCSELTSDGPEYSLGQLQNFRDTNFVSAAKKITLGQIPKTFPKNFTDLLENDARIKATWNGHRGDLKDQSRSAHDMSMATMLAKHDFKPEEIAAVLRKMPTGRNTTATTKYLELTISKAVAIRNASTISLPHQGEGVRAEANIKLLTWRGFLSTVPVERNWLVKDLLPQTGLGVLQGRGKHGKSTFVRHLAGAVAQGTPFLGRETNSAPVIYVNYEMPDDYLRTLIQGAPIPKKAYLVNRPQATLGLNTIEVILGKVKSSQGLLIIDSFRGAFKLHGDAENSAGGAGVLLRQLQELAIKTGWFFLVIHHSNRTSSEGTNSVSGTGDWIAAPDVIFSWDRPNSELPGTLYVEGRLPPVQPLSIRLSPEACIFEGTVKESKEATDKELILAVLTEEGRTSNEIAELTGLAEGTVRERLRSLHDNGLIDRNGRGRANHPYLWSILLPQGPETPSAETTAEALQAREGPDGASNYH